MNNLGVVQMSNIEVAQAIYRRFGQGDIPGVMALLHPEIDWIWYGPQEIPWAGTHKGHQDMLKFFGAIGATVSVEAYEPREFLPGENGLVTVLGWQRVRVKATHKAWETNWAHVWTIQDGLVVRAREFYDTVPVLAAFK
ncbi:nuclear transport factor 2 family protein [uncultured Meiothermus sp.]|uniref:nuclear transport factor 2 family protein n=1 Tax=uncultured Meiothermus sp. TaxID=157471 RepID=UPI002625A45F|nr:nuclear transport factor 2 family protein [uncultured Meiothermus sp.]